MKSLWGFFLLSCVATLDTRHSGEYQKFRCDYTYFHEAEGFLKLHEIPLTWEDARLRCTAEGARLASPLNDGLRAAMKKMMDAKKLSCAMFTGVQATLSKGVFTSLEGVSLNKIPHSWTINEPDNYNGIEDCTVLLNDGISMADVPCNETFPYTCYKSKYTVGKFMETCGTTDPEYTYDARTGNCYKFHKTPRTWSRAYMTCEAEGGQLAIINSDTEATVIKEIYEKYPANTILGNFDKDWAFVGVYYSSSLGYWLTIHDETFEQAGYTKWSPGEPNNAKKDEFCGTVTRNAMFNDQTCSYPSVFICEKDPKSLVCVDY